MRVLFITRNPKLGFSIGKNFAPIIENMKNYCEVDSIILPIPSASPFAILRNIRFANKFAKTGCYDVVHITGDSHYLIPFLYHKRICCTVHDLGFVETETRLLKKVWNYCLWIYSLKFAKRLAFISEKSMNEANSLVKLDHNKEIVIPNAVGKEYVRCPKIVNKGKPVLLHIGTFPRKNLINTIKAISGLSYHLRIIGILDSEQEHVLNQSDVDYSVASNLSNQQIVEEYNRCDAVNFPSLYEGFGQPIIEAQSVGRPVLTSNISPMKEVAGKGAVLVDPVSPKSIREGYEYLFNNYERIVEDGYENVKNYELDTITKSYFDLYNSMLLS